MIFVSLDPFQEVLADEYIPVCPVDEIVDEYDLTPAQEIYLEKAEDFYGR